MSEMIQIWNLKCLILEFKLTIIPIEIDNSQLTTVNFRLKTTFPLRNSRGYYYWTPIMCVNHVGCLYRSITSVLYSNSIDHSYLEAKEEKRKKRARFESLLIIIKILLSLNILSKCKVHVRRWGEWHIESTKSTSASKHNLGFWIRKGRSVI
jgi:hypothetical protein